MLIVHGSKEESYNPWKVLKKREMVEAILKLELEQQEGMDF